MTGVTNTLRLALAVQFGFGERGRSRGAPGSSNRARRPARSRTIRRSPDDEDLVRDPLALTLGLAGASLAVAPPFDEVDQNKDGTISRAEASVVETLDFAKADTNRDGKLDRAEYTAATS